MKLKFKLNLQQFGGPSTVDINGQTYSTALGGTGAYWNLNEGEIKTLITQINEKGRPLTPKEIYDLGLFVGTDSGYKIDRLVAAQKRIIEQNPSKFGFSAEGTVVGQEGLAPATGEDGQVGAFNEYYRDLYSLEPGTGGAEMLGRLEQSYANQAQQAATVADVGFQQAALQQASTVKAITDQVRGERMARLRAGMSESQIANQDMQMLMANVNTLNQNAQMLNQQRLEAQVGMNTSQDQAYMDFLNQANTRGQVATGMAASDAGDAYQQTIRQMTTLYGNDPTQWTSQQWSTVSNQVTGQNQPT
jgi:hypothetical protein